MKINPNKPNIHEILGIVRKIPWVVLFSAYIIEEDKIKPEPITDIIVLRLCLLISILSLCISSDLFSISIF